MQHVISIFDIDETAADIASLIAGSKDVERLRQLEHALTKSVRHSNYANLPASIREELACAARARIAELRGSSRRAPASKKREKREPPKIALQEVLDFFGDTARLPRRPYCADDLSAGLRIRSLEQALTKPYIQANPPHLRVWSIFDVDRPGAALAWEDANLLPPTWAAVNRENGHAHLVWGLSAPVLVDSPDMRQGPLRYLAGVESNMREVLRADDGYSGLITKNPMHPLWQVLRGPRLGYELGELAECLPGLEKHIPKRGKIEEIGLGRNCTLFDWLRHWAYRAVRQYKRQGGLDAWNAWLNACNLQALQRNGEFQHPLDLREVWHIAKSVAKWTWRNFSEAGFSAWQAQRGRKGGLAKGMANEDRRASARLMAAKGMTQAAIAEALGVHVNTVANWLR